MPTPTQAATRQVFERYAELLKATPFNGVFPLTGGPHLFWMCQTAIAELDTWPIDKASRWLGFVQGVMVMHGVLSVAEERSVTRELFHAAYREEGISVPASVSPPG